MTVLGNMLQLAGSIFLVLGYLPQIQQLYKTKKSDDISLSFWVVLTVGLLCITANMIISSVAMPILLTQVVNSILAIWTLVLVKKYKSHK